MKDSWNIIITLGLLVVMSVGWANPAMAQESKGMLPIISPIYPQVLKAIEQLTPGQHLQVLLATEKDVYQVGEAFEVRFAASEESYVTLMRIATDGTITFLTPNSQYPDFKIQAETVYSTGSLTPLGSEEQALYDLGMTLNANMPAGTEVLNMFCSREKLALFDVGEMQEGMYIIRPDDEARLQALFDRLETLSQLEWAGSSVAFLVRPTPAPAVASDGELPVSKEASGKSSLSEKSPLIPEAGAQKRLPRRFGALPPMGATGTTGKSSFPAIGSTNITGAQ